MEAAAPALLSGLGQTLLRRPPSLREMVTIVGYADDYAWFTGLVRHLFPQEAEEALSAPDVRTRVERFARLFAERHFPLYAPYFEFWMEDGDEPSWTWLRRGIPFDLMGFGYEGVHELWNGYRDGISALLLLVKPPDSFYGESDEIRTAWLESAAEHIPQSTLERIPQGGIPVETLTEAVKDTRFEGAAKAASWVFAETGNFFLDACYEDGSLRRLRRPLGRRDHQGGHGGVAEGQRPDGLGLQPGRLAGGGPPGPLRRDAGRRPAPGSRTTTRTRKGGRRP